MKVGRRFVLAWEHEFFILEACECAQAFEEEEHAGKKEGHDGNSDYEKADPCDGADGLIVEFAGVFGIVIDFFGAEKVLREEEVEEGGEEKGAGEYEGALKKKFAIRFLFCVFFNLLIDAFDVKNLLVVEKSVEEGGFGPMGNEDGKPEDEGDGGFFESKKDGSGGVDGAVFFPKK